MERAYFFLFIEKRTFSCVSASGGTPQRLIENVNSAVFTPNGESLVLLRPVEGKGTNCLLVLHRARRPSLFRE